MQIISRWKYYWPKKIGFNFDLCIWNPFGRFFCVCLFKQMFAVFLININQKLKQFSKNEPANIC
jgi:hypothetical protein